jgi:hypothetical protein
MIRSETAIAASGTSKARRRSAKYAPPNRATASTGEKFGGTKPGLKWYSRRVATAARIIAPSASGPGLSLLRDCGMETAPEGARQRATALDCANSNVKPATDRLGRDA